MISHFDFLLGLPFNLKDSFKTQPAFTWSKLPKETLEQGVKYVQS